MINIIKIKGIGNKKKEILNKKKIYNVIDLLNNIPKKYININKHTRINELKSGDIGFFKCKVINVPISKKVKGYLITKIHVMVEDKHAYLVFFNQKYIAKKFLKDQELWVEGKIKVIGSIIEIYPRICEETDNRNEIRPIYKKIYNINSNEYKKWIVEALDIISNSDFEILPNRIINKLNLLKQSEAYREIHFPTNRENFIRAKKTLSFTELFVFQCGIKLIKKKKYESNVGISFKTDLESETISKLPFELTDSQKEVINQIGVDMMENKRMHRLIQGDVGSGKTIVAFIAMINSFNSGYQSVMMAPTEILAIQHYTSFCELFPNLKIASVMLVGGMKNKCKIETKQKIENGEIKFIFGTHALIQNDVVFNKLGLTITDEQHRFGVLQRNSLKNKSLNNDVLVMSATPIPRTLALIIYGDLNISIINQMPVGRKKIITKIVKKKEKNKLYNFIKQQIEKGFQIYYVCPKIEDDDEESKISSVEKIKKELGNIFDDKEVAILHGKMKNEEKKLTMDKYINKEIKILISTTVIEVGVNVPNANVMIIDNAERFGLAQIHQLRGRVGRSSQQAYCFLISESEKNERLKVLEKSSDGFFIANEDLKLRGPGYFFGTQQHGLPVFKFSNLYENTKILEYARDVATEYLSYDEKLSKKESVGIKRALKELFNEVEEIDFDI